MGTTAVGLKVPLDSTVLSVGSLLTGRATRLEICAASGRQTRHTQALHLPAMAPIIHSTLCYLCLWC